MNYILIKNRNTKSVLDTPVKLHNGSIVFLKFNNQIVDVYYVISFRDNNNRYNGDLTAPYCSMINLDSGQLAFQERCSRNTTVRRVLKHLVPTAYIDTSDMELGGYDIEVHNHSTYHLEISLS